MRRFENKFPSITWFLTMVWIVVFGSLSYIALVEKSITLGGKGGIHHYEGMWAVGIGFALWGMTLIGVSWLFSLHAFERLIRLLLALIWIGSIAVYFVYFT